MKETHYYLAPSCGSVPESLRHWYLNDYSRDEVACIARGIVIGLRADGREITFNCPMSWGSSGAYDVFAEVSQELTEKFGIRLNYDDVRSGFVIQTHKQVKTDSALEHPERWRLAQVNAVN